MSKILIVCHYFPPEVGAPQTRLSEFARLWAEAGDEVTVLTGFPNHPTGVIPREYRGKIRMEEQVDGYRVVRTWLYATPNEGVLRKTLGHLSFMVTSVLLGWRKVGRPDVVLVSSPTFFSIFSALFIARIKKARFVLEVRDLWPAAIVELGLLRNGPLVRVLERIELAFYRAADRIVPTTHGLARAIIERGIDGSKVQVVTNGVDPGRFSGATDVGPVRSRLGAKEGHVLILYAGTHGMLYDLALVAGAAGELSGEPVHFAFVGEGVGKPRLAGRVQELGLTNVSLHPAVPARELPSVISAADICLIPLRDTPMVDLVIAAKTFEYLAAGKPVVGCLRGESSDILRAAGARVVDPGDLASFVKALRELIADPGMRDQMGRNGAAFVRENYDRRDLACAYRKALHV